MDHLSVPALRQLFQHFAFFIPHFAGCIPTSRPPMKMGQARNPFEPRHHHLKPVKTRDKDRPAPRWIEIAFLDALESPCFDRAHGTQSLWLQTLCLLNLALIPDYIGVILWRHALFYLLIPLGPHPRFDHWPSPTLGMQQIANPLRPSWRSIHTQQLPSQLTQQQPLIAMTMHHNHYQQIQKRLHQPPV